MERQTIEINNVICEIIATYHDDSRNKDFIIYTDKTFNENNKLNIYCGLYKEINDKKIVYEIKEELDKKFSLELIKSIIEKLR